MDLVVVAFINTYLPWHLRRPPFEENLLDNCLLQLLATARFQNLYDRGQARISVLRGMIGFFIFHLPSSLLHLLEMRSSAYVSPVIMYFPVSPVAPPKMTTFDFDTIIENKR